MLEIYILLSLRKNIATVSGRTSLTLGITYVKLKQILNNIYEMKNINLWYNKEIRINNKPVFLYKFWADGNIYYIKDILIGDGSILCFEEFSQKFESTKTSFITYEGIKRAVDHDIKNLNIKNRKEVNHVQLDFPFSYKILFKTRKAVKTFIIF